MSGFAIAGLLFLISSLIWTATGDVPIAMMNVCIGVMFLSFSSWRKKK
ncbi:MAG TPA: hypothetical protein VFT82_00360 [Candidatus Paceibacterota bacterium]|nr:hypothetical protein [Candidatus Paceibacterota bacterium]